MNKNCFLWFKDTKMKANHNHRQRQCMRRNDCFLWFKDTKMKANHNGKVEAITGNVTVSYGSKILK